MKKKTLYKTVVRLEFLSEEPIGDMSMEDMIYNASEGDLSLLTEVMVLDKPIIGKMAVKELENHGTDLEFFNIDSRGYDTQDDDYDTED
jgi:hypothetical protein